MLAFVYLIAMLPSNNPILWLVPTRDNHVYGGVDGWPMETCIITEYPNYKLVT